ncbi:MAG: type II toxin-antitoxin system RelE/ParE family toxin [Planctomycetaceae bacterium]|nr:type II toxin-antitoxin system RelE/ParE family toxin [Planctomycetaceae bacterium]MCB9952165.1 type II toxin-antitoxin system RelE/ParE family toxin [Planctomycetaceae bacterium]
MTYRVQLTERAKRDVERNAQWWAQHYSVSQAIEWFDTIHVQLQQLANFPESHAASPESSEFPYVIRNKFVGLGQKPSYRAVFTVREDVVYVLSVQRFAQDRLVPGDY